MSNEHRCKKHNEILKHKTVKCYKCGGTGEERWLMLFAKECSACHGRGKLDHYESCKKCEAERRSRLFAGNEVVFGGLAKRSGGNVGMKCPACNGTGKQIASKEVRTWGHLSKVSGVGRRNVPISRPCPICRGTGKKSW